jgi:UDP:flavonoid glycosyltransferase YjiC (YdhE family)
MKPRVLLIGEAVTLTHVVRPAELAGALHGAGFDVTLACDPRFNALLGPRPFRTIALKSSIDAETSTDFLKKSQPLFDTATLGAYIREDLRLMRLLQPQLVVGDMRQSLAVSARLVKVPYINVINAHWSPWSDEPFALVDNPLSRMMSREAADRVFDLLSPVGSVMMALPLNVARVNHGLPPLGLGLKEAYAAGDYVVYPDIPELNPTRPLPAEHRYIGPVHWSPQVARPSWWDSLPADKPVVYVNLGSSGEPALLDSILAAFADLPVTILVGTTQRGSVSAAPANAFVADYIPGDAAASRAALVVCNGGASSGYQSLSAGTPFLGIPSNTDQLAFARLSTRAGVADCLMEGAATAANVRYLASKMLESANYREAAKRLSAILATRDAPACFVSFVKDILKTPVTAAG